MFTLHAVIFWTHIVAGALALVLFWVPLFTAKGQLNHVRFGHYFKLCMYVVGIGGILMSLIVIAAPFQIKPDAAGASDPENVKRHLRLFWGFLGLLGLLTIVTTRHGITVLLLRNQRQGMRQLNYVLPIIALFIAGAVYGILGISTSHILFIIFGILCMAVSLSTLRYIYAAQVAARTWILEHIGNMLGSGIAAYTAFLTFGSRRLIDLGDYQVIVWIAPGIIGTIASYWLSKKYKRLFNIDTQSSVSTTQHR